MPTRELHGAVSDDEVTIQQAIEEYQVAHGKFPHKLSIVLNNIPTLISAFERIGRSNVSYELHDSRGYLLTFVHTARSLLDGKARDEMVIRVEDHSSHLSRLAAAPRADL